MEVGSLRNSQQAGRGISQLATATAEQFREVLFWTDPREIVLSAEAMTGGARANSRGVSSDCATTLGENGDDP